MARSAFVIQASLADYERRFSIAGQIVPAQRSQPNPDTVESFIVLEEAYGNKI